MKKRLLLAAASLMFSAVALTGYKVYSYATMTDQERLMFENIEALTADEKDKKPKQCYNTIGGSSKDPRPVLPDIIYCYTCEPIECTYVNNESICPL